MSYSEGLQQKHDNNISPEILKKLDNIQSQINPEFALEFEKFRSGALKILEENPEYSDDDIVIKAIEEQSSRLLRVLSSDYKKSKITLATMQAANDDIDANDDIELKIAA